MALMAQGLKRKVLISPDEVPTSWTSNSIEIFLGGRLRCGLVIEAPPQPTQLSAFIVTNRDTYHANYAQSTKSQNQ